MGLESMIEKDACALIEKLGGMTLKFVSPNNAGVPDRVFSHPNCGPFWIEFKAPLKKMEAHQEAMAKRMAKAGFRVYRNVSNIVKAREIILGEVTAGAAPKHEPVRP